MGTQFSEISEVGKVHDPKTRIVGVGVAARSWVDGLNGKVVNPFGHPRSLVSDFTVAEQLLKTVVRQVLGSALFQVGRNLSDQVLLNEKYPPDGEAE